jgi:hypothetical protein
MTVHAAPTAIDPRELRTAMSRFATGVAVVTTFIVSLMCAGFVERDPNSNRYVLGAEALRVGLVALARSDVIEIAAAELNAAAYARRTGQAGRTRRRRAQGRGPWPARPVSIFRDVLELPTRNRRRRSAPTFVTDKAR